MSTKINKTRIRPISITDVAAVSEIIRNAFLDVANRFNLTEQNCPKHPSNCTEQWVRDALQKGVRYYVLEVEGMQCGCVALEQASAEVCYLERLAVLPAYRRNGHGRTLVEHVLGEARTLGAQRVDIGIIAEQTELQEWYRRLGFEVTRKAVFDHLPFDVIFMTIAI